MDEDTDNMDQFSVGRIISQRFRRVRRGYDTMAVDLFLEELALYVEQLQRELAAREQTERSALLLLRNARATADETIIGALAAAESERAEAERTAQALVQDAEARVRAILVAADNRIAMVQRELDNRRKMIGQMEASLRAAADEIAPMALPPQPRRYPEPVVIDTHDALTSG